MTSIVRNNTVARTRGERTLIRANASQHTVNIKSIIQRLAVVDIQQCPLNITYSNYNFFVNRLTIWAGSIHKTIKKIPAMINKISAIQAA